MLSTFSARFLHSGFRSNSSLIENASELFEEQKWLSGHEISNQDQEYLYLQSSKLSQCSIFKQLFVLFLEVALSTILPNCFRNWKMRKLVLWMIQFLLKSSLKQNHGSCDQRKDLKGDPFNHCFSSVSLYGFAASHLK